MDARTRGHTREQYYCHVGFLRLAPTLQARAFLYPNAASGVHVMDTYIHSMLSYGIHKSWYVPASKIHSMLAGHAAQYCGHIKPGPVSITRDSYFGVPPLPEGRVSRSYVPVCPRAPSGS